MNKNEEHVRYMLSHVIITVTTATVTVTATGEHLPNDVNFELMQIGRKNKGWERVKIPKNAKAKGRKSLCRQIILLDVLCTWEIFQEDVENCVVIFSEMKLPLSNIQCHQ